MATEHTAEFIENQEFKNIQHVYKISEPDCKPNISDLLFSNAKFDFIVNIPSTSTIEKYVGMLYDIPNEEKSSRNGYSSPDYDGISLFVYKNFGVAKNKYSDNKLSQNLCQFIKYTKVTMIVFPNGNIE